MSTSVTELLVTFIILVIRGVAFIYGVLTAPLFVLYALLRPTNDKSGSKKLAYSTSGLGEGPWRSVEIGKNEPLQSTAFDGIETLYESWQHSAKLYPNSRCMGQRPVLAEFTEKDATTGKSTRKLKLGAYQWATYAECATKIERLGIGLSSLAGVRRGAHVAFYCETRSEWMCAALATLQQRAIVVTFYATLSIEALDTALKESEPCCIITTSDLLEEKLARLTLPSSVTHVVIVNEQKSSSPASLKSGTKVNILSYNDLIKAGAESSATSSNSLSHVSADDVAVVMYTSGTTGRPKGVILTHRNVLASVAAGSRRVGLSSLNPRATFLGYLPLAHVLEFACEMAALVSGSSIGYGSPHTMTKQSPRIHDCEGDLVELQPTLLPGVPIILERFAKGIREKLGLSCDLQAFVTKASSRETQSGKEDSSQDKKQRLAKLSFGALLKSRIGEMIVAEKIAAYERGVPTPIIDALVCRKLAAALGGRLKYMMIGGAPLNRATQTAIAALFRVQVASAYGLTETSAGACMTHLDLTVDLHGSAGEPVTCSEMLLRSWSEAGYTDDVLKSKVTDKKSEDWQFPRGELLISGPNVFSGYFRNEEETQRAFVELNGKRWFTTGDIVEVLADGSFRIIDRRKDCFKLENGEYIAPGRIEAALQSSSFVESVCIIGNSSRNYLVGLLVPKRVALMKLARDLGILNGSKQLEAADAKDQAGKSHTANGSVHRAKDEIDEESWQRVCNNDRVRAAVLEDFARVGSKLGLPRVEIPARIHICTEIWSCDNGLLTDSLKLRRRNIETFYRSVIELLYAAKTI